MEFFRVKDFIIPLKHIKYIEQTQRRRKKDGFRIWEVHFLNNEKIELSTEEAEILLKKIK